MLCGLVTFLFLHNSTQRKLLKSLMPFLTLKVSYLIFSYVFSLIIEFEIIGAAIIRMMNDFLGEATFREGVKNYLNEKYDLELE